MLLLIEKCIVIIIILQDGKKRDVLEGIIGSLSGVINLLLILMFF